MRRPIASANLRYGLLSRKQVTEELPTIRQLVARLCVVSVITTYRQVLPQATIFRMTKERWAQIGITTEFLIVVRTLGEFFRLRHVHGTNFSTAVAALYVGGALIAACSCWAGVTFYFFRRYTVSAWITLATVPVLLVYKIAVIGW
jgi:hypothetical protein